MKNSPKSAIVEAYRGRLIRIFTQETVLPNGKKLDFEFAERSPGVRVLVHTSSGLLLNREWREENKSYDMRLPGGKVFDTLLDYIAKRDIAEEQILQIARAAACRELLEETGLSVQESSCNFHNKSVCGATVVWDLWYFSVEFDAEPHLRGQQISHEGESTAPFWVTNSEALELCLNGRVSEDRSAAFLFRHLLSVKKC